MRNFASDVRYAARALRKNPGFAAVAILLLALGIGANALVFSLLDGILLRPLPFRDPARLAAIWETTRSWDPKIFGCYRDMEVFERKSEGREIRAVQQTAEIEGRYGFKHRAAALRVRRDAARKECRHADVGGEQGGVKLRRADAEDGSVLAGIRFVQLLAYVRDVQHGRFVTLGGAPQRGLDGTEIVFRGH
jgi:hypothetical protein